jgi:hypothetical protein
MKKCYWWLLIILCAIPPIGIAQSKPVRLFDGKTFKGWEGNLKLFRIEQGAIIGGSVQEKLEHNEFLCTTKEYSDFVLRVKFKLLGDPKGANAGIQFRSARIPNHFEVIGYQADVGQTYWGALYDESRRRKVLAGPTPEVVQQIIRPNDWNDYLIRAEGRRVRLELNGRQTADYTETDETIKQSGCICLQIHGGPPSEAWYKDITLETLPAKQ